MSVQPFFRYARGRGLAIFLGLIVPGCGNFALFDSGGSRPTLNLSTLGVGDDSTHFESGLNEAFENAEFVPAGASGRVIRGEIEDANDVDVYDLGPVATGDRVVVDMTAVNSLDGALALFDETGASLLVNDHRNVYLGASAPFIDVVIQHDSAACFVAVSATPGYAGTGEYGLIASKSGPTPLPPKRPDTVLLMFDGGRGVRIGSRSPVDVPRFDAVSLSDSFDGSTDDMVAEIVVRVRDHFEGYDVTILSTGEGADYDAGFTRIYFGTYDEALLGVAEGVDEFNLTYGQVAIVFTDTFRAFNRLSPSLEQMAQALANVASHEIGHLMGLVHTRDAEGIMDVTASLKRLMLNQDFMRSPIYEGVFPLGEQDDVRYLGDAVGGDRELVAEKALIRQLRIPTLLEDDDGIPAREELRLSTCGLEH